MLWPKLKLYVVLGCSVSLIFIVMVLVGVVGKIDGSYFIGGEIINCLFRFFNLIFSSNTNLISFPLKFLLKFFGKLTFITGAMVSFEPPVMEPLLAHPTTIKRNKKKVYFKLFFNISNHN